MVTNISAQAHANGIRVSWLAPWLLPHSYLLIYFGRLLCTQRDYIQEQTQVTRNETSQTIVNVRPGSKFEVGLRAIYNIAQLDSLRLITVITPSASEFLLSYIHLKVQSIYISFF